MAANFLKYDGPLIENDLLIDAHELIAPSAPRPVFLAAAAAGPVYKLLDKKDLGVTDFPPIETPLINGDLAFRQHTGGHTPTPNWPTFLTFASRYVKAPPPTPAGFPFCL